MNDPAACCGVYCEYSMKRSGDKIMRYLPNGTQMSAADRHTIENVGIPSLVLMERAALKTVETMHIHGIDTSRALVVCGSGNNGGDGFAVARLLTEEGTQAHILFAGREASMSRECGVHKRIAENLGIRIFTEIPEEEYTVIIDAVFGVGLSREISGKYADIIEWMNARECEKVAVDIPSGVSAASGRILGTAFRADLTVAMACVKTGCEMYPGKYYAGDTVAVPIGIDPEIFASDEEVCITYDRADIPGLLPERNPDSHKGSYGKVLMITGSSGMAGAAYLSAKAAYTVGAGLVQIYTAQENRSILQELLPEAIISCYQEYDDGQLIHLLEWADVVCIGCGLGTGEVSEMLLEGVLSKVRVPCIIDADGLNLLSRKMNLLEQIQAPLILTPHMKEMSRLTGISVTEIADRRMDIVREFTDRYPAVCVLKDSRTIVKSKGNHPFLNLAGNSGMAKAGAGDVLAGVITGLSAQGMSAYESAALGVYLHACGGDEAREEKGSYSMLARDLIAGIGRCMKNNEENHRRDTENETA